MATADISLLPRIIAARSGRMPRPVPQVPISKSTPPIMWDTFGGPQVPPSVAYPEIGMVSLDPYQVVPGGDVYEEQIHYPTGDVNVVQPEGPSFKDRLKATLPRMIQGGIDAAATPNIAGGGPTDFFRAMQAAQAGAANRDLAAYDLERQRRLDAQQEELRQAQMTEYRAQAARNQALANQPPKQTAPKAPNIEDQLYGAWLTAATPEEKQAAWERFQEYKHGQYKYMPGYGYKGPSGDVTVPVPKPAAAPRPTAERAKVDLLKQGYIAQGMDEATAEEKALSDYAASYKAGTEQKKASASASRASAGSSSASAAETGRKTEEGTRKSKVQQLADAALAESRAGLITAGNPNPTQEQIEANAIANLGPDKTQYYPGYTGPERVSAAAEIQKRRKQPKKGGLMSVGKGNGGAPAPGAPAPQIKRIRVRLGNGQTGTINENQFDAATMTKL